MDPGPSRTSDLLPGMEGLKSSPRIGLIVSYLIFTQYGLLQLGPDASFHVLLKIDSGLQ